MKAYLVPAALAASLGVNVILATGGVPEAHATPMDRTVVVEATLGVGAADTLEGWLVANVCPEVVAAFGVCSIDDLRDSHGVTLKREQRDGDAVPLWRAKVNVRKAGTWVAQEVP